MRKPAVIHRCSPYLEDAFGDPDEVVRTVRRAMRGESVRYDTIVGTGLSGALIIPHVARALNKHWTIVRKPKDSVHASGTIEGNLGRRWLFLDDIISSGRTRKTVIKAVEQFALQYDHRTTYVGTCIYGRFAGGYYSTHE